MSRTHPKDMEASVESKQGMSEPTDWQGIAYNQATASDNKIHSDEAAKRRAAERKEATVQAYAALEAVLKDANASEEQINAAFDSVGACVRKFAESVLEAFAFEDAAEAAKREEFPELFR